MLKNIIRIDVEVKNMMDGEEAAGGGEYTRDRVLIALGDSGIIITCVKSNHSYLRNTELIYEIPISKCDTSAA